MLSAGDACIGLHLGDENSPSIYAWDRPGVYPEVLSYQHRFDARGQATTVDARHGLASSTCLVSTPLLSHCFNRVLFEIAGYIGVCKLKKR